MRLPAAEPVPVAIEGIVDAALAHSYELRTRDLDVAAAAAKRDQARAKQLPQFEVDGRASRYAGLTDSAFGPFFTIPAIESRYAAGVSVSQPAYTGGRITSQKEGAQAEKLEAQENRRANGADVTYRALAAYWSWSKAFYALDSLRAAVARMEAHEADMNHRHEAGLATDNETLATTVLLDQTRLRLTEAQRQVDLSRAHIAFLIGRELDAGSVPLMPAPVGAGPVPSLGALLAAAQANRAEPAAHRHRVLAMEASVRGSRANRRPQVSLTARYEQARPNLLNIPPTDRWMDDAFAGVTVSWNVFDWGLARAKVAEASARADQARLWQRQVEEQVVLEVREARINLEDALARLTVARRTEQSAQLNLEAATDLWRNGLARHAELLDAHAQLTNTQFDVVAAKADVLVARAALDHAIGVLDRAGPDGSQAAR